MEYKRRKKIGVIGATGHIGSYLIPTLVRAGYDVVGYSRGNSEPYHYDDFDWDTVCMLKLDKKEAVANILHQDFDVICHLIAYDETDIKDLCETVYQKKHWMDMQLIVIGSIWMWGEKYLLPVDESHERVPICDYGRGKLEVENYLKKQNNLNYTLIHPGHICGKGWIPVNPHGNRNPECFEKIKKGEEICLPKEQFSLHHVHSQDIADLILCCIGEEKARAENFMIACERAYTLQGFAKELYQYYGKEPLIKLVDYQQFLNGMNKEDAMVTEEHLLHSSMVSVDKIKQVLGYEPKYSELDTIVDSLEAMDL